MGSISGTASYVHARLYDRRPINRSLYVLSLLPTIPLCVLNWTPPVHTYTLSLTHTHSVSLIGDVAAMFPQVGLPDGGAMLRRRFYGVARCQLHVSCCAVLPTLLLFLALSHFLSRSRALSGAAPTPPARTRAHTHTHTHARTQVSPEVRFCGVYSPPERLTDRVL